MTGHPVDLRPRLRVADVLAVLGRLLKYAGGKGVAMNVVPNASSAGQLERVRLALARFRKLLPGWDGDGASPVSEQAISAAETVLGKLRSDLVPRVAALADGAVQMCWTRITQKGRLEIEARFHEESTSLVVRYAHLPGYEVDEEIHDPARVADLVEQRLRSER